MVCSDYYYNVSSTGLHCSDHFIGLKTEVFKRTFELVKILCEYTPKETQNNLADPQWFGMNGLSTVTESIIFSCYLRSRYILPTATEPQSTVALYSECVKREHLGRYVISSNNLGLIFTPECPEHQGGMRL